MTELTWQASLFENPTGYSVSTIRKQDTHHLLLNVHYAKRIPSISHAFGLFENKELVGVCTFGSPASPSLVSGVAGLEWSKNVTELNRLCLVNNKPNEASKLIAASLALLPKPTIVVSYSDTAHDHIGVVYQATNFLYTGVTAERKEWGLADNELLHAKAISNLAKDRGIRPIEFLKETYGDNFVYRTRSAKHRYVFFAANKSDRKKMMSALRYPILPYPKKSND